MICSSMSWPNMFDVARNKVNVYTEMKSITNRVKLLMLTEPTELYMNPRFGVGLRKYMFTYNNDNTIAMIKDKLIEQLRMWEPRVIPEKTEVMRSNQTGINNGVSQSNINNNNLGLTVVVTSIYGTNGTIEVTESDLSNKLI